MLTAIVIYKEISIISLSHPMTSIPPYSDQHATCSCLSPEMARSSFQVHSKFIHRFSILGERISSKLGIIPKKKQVMVAC
ncbi:hypothetical protein K5X82_00585 [Halosquirtibacter xylanolyticus]|uniref:hypothetical protein n=1 Tax=Halosquirtibacter xylanolyticus TaxID=3374599 RepID=UPI00374904AE|nr:hypothetical protein K5X82_00585 [Prolixibacteraceae bacterium]